jgi:hypothetical protein
MCSRLSLAQQLLVRETPVEDPTHIGSRSLV